MTGDYDIEAFESTIEEFMEMAVGDLSFGVGTYLIDSHDHDDGSIHEGISGTTYSIMATTISGDKHHLMFTPIQVEAIARDMAQFIFNISGGRDATS